METVRIFAALDFEPSVKRDISKQLVRSSFNGDWVNWESLDRLHLTLHFWPNFPLLKIDLLLPALEQAADELKSMTAIFDQPLIIGQGKPRVLALATKNNQQFRSAFELVENAIAENHVSARENRRFTPHITLGRVKGPMPASAIDQFRNWQCNFELTFDSIVLIESILTPRGSEFTVLDNFPLQ